MQIGDGNGSKIPLTVMKGLIQIKNGKGEIKFFLHLKIKKKILKVKY